MLNKLNYNAPANLLPALPVLLEVEPHPHPGSGTANYNHQEASSSVGLGYADAGAADTGRVSASGVTFWRSKGHGNQVSKSRRELGRRDTSDEVAATTEQHQWARNRKEIPDGRTASKWWDHSTAVDNRNKRILNYTRNHEEHDLRRKTNENTHISNERPYLYTNHKRSHTSSNISTHHKRIHNGSNLDHKSHSESSYTSTYHRIHSLSGFTRKPQGRQGFMANALFHAVRTCRFSRVKVLIDQGLRPSVKDGDGRNLLMACLDVDDITKRTRMFSYLLRRGVDPNYVDPTSGRDVLTCAVVRCMEEQVRQLLDATVGDVDLRRTDHAGFTALHHAAMTGNLNIVRMLLATMQRYQVPVDVYDAEGLTPYLHARRLGHHDVSDVLLRLGQASPRLADKHSFRAPDEWEAEGVQERHRKLRQNRLREYIQRKISGRLLFPVVVASTDGSTYPLPDVKSGHVPRIYVSAEDLSRSVGDQTNGGDNIDGGVGDTSSYQNSNRSGMRNGRLQVPNRKLSEFGGSQRSLLGKAGVKGTSTLNLMEDAAILTNTDQAARFGEFKSSEFDVNKQNEYKAIGLDVSALMTSLSEQQSSSYRKTVVPPPPEKRPPPVESKPKKEKVSTLAILMGKGGGGRKGKSKKKVSGTEKKKKDGKKKGGVALPRIN